MLLKKRHPDYATIILFFLNYVSGVGVTATTATTNEATTADSSGASTGASSNETNTGASSPGAHS